MSARAGGPGTGASTGTVAVALRLLRQCAGGEGASMILGLFLLIAGSALTVLQPWPLKLVVDSVLGNEPAPPALAGFADLVASAFGLLRIAGIALLVVLALAILLIQVLYGTIIVASHYVLVAVGLRMVFKLRCSLFDHVQRLSLRFHDANRVGDSLYRVTWDTYSVQALFNEGVIPAVTETVTLLGIAVMMMSRDVVAATLALAVGIPLMLLIKGLDRPMTEHSLRVHERESSLSSRVQETLTGIRAVQAFGREEFEAARFKRHAGESLKANLRLTVLQTGAQALVGLLLAIGTAAVVFVGAWRGLSGRLTPGDVVLLASYVAMLYKPLETLANTAVAVQGAVAGARRVFALQDTCPDVADQPGAVDLPEKVAGRIAFEEVSFGYREGERILDRLSLEIVPGSTVALVGASGAGKTTLSSLLLRFYDPDSGRITLDGRDLRSLRLASLRRNVAIVLQEPVLFSASVRENIEYGRPGASLVQIEEAARAAAAHEFIDALPDGYETWIGERGTSLSGGQKQRIAIARAFLKDAPVLVMDEPTNALDAETEETLLETIRRLAKGRTTLVIAHRLSTIRGADRIVVIKNGRVAEQGTHKELRIRGELYAHLHDLQLGTTGTREWC